MLKCEMKCILIMIAVRANWLGLQFILICKHSYNLEYDIVYIMYGWQGLEEQNGRAIWNMHTYIFGSVTPVLKQAAEDDSTHPPITHLSFILHWGGCVCNPV